MAKDNDGAHVSGTKQIVVSQGASITVAAASYDPGYSLKNSLPDTTEADLLYGFCDSGRAVGEGR